MEINWKELATKCDALQQELLNPALDVKRRREAQQEQSYLKQLLDAHERLVLLNNQIAQIESSIESEDPQMRELYLDELADLKVQQNEATTMLDERLFPADPLDDRSVFLEIRAGTGGQEAALFAGDLLRMYSNYALSKGWAASLVDSSSTDLGGIREVTLHIEGKGVYAHLKHESGVHRVQRVPKTEASGRIHTSTATIAVLPEAEEVDIQINPADLRIDTYRAGGAGGQHVNKTDSAVRITHIPSGIVVACQDERSQHKNRAKAMKVLQSRLLAAEKEKHEAEVSQQRKEMVGAGSRSEKVRTYNFPQNRITDHQVDVTLKKLDIVMEGVLDELVEPLMARERQERRKHPILKK